MQITTTPCRRLARLVPSRLLPVLGLLVLAPFCAEYLIGAISVRDLPALPFLIPLYGAAAVLIREVTRRTRRGRACMLLLAAAFGVFQAGIVDASLFNPDYAGLDLDGADVPVLHFSAVFGLAFVMNHVMLSVGAPITLIETLAPEGEAEPWLGRFGLIVTALSYLCGSLLIGWDNWMQEHFYPSPLQLTFAGVIVAALIGLALGRPRRPHRPARPAPGQAPSPLRIGLFTAATSGAYMFVPANWAGLVLGVLLVTVAVTLLGRWSRAAGWGERHRIAVAAGVLFTAAWGAFAVGSFIGLTDPLTRAGNVTFALVMAVLVGWCLHRAAGKPDFTPDEVQIDHLASNSSTNQGISFPTRPPAGSPAP